MVSPLVRSRLLRHGGRIAAVSSHDRDVKAFDDRAATYESGRHGQLHKEISERVVALALSRVAAE